MLKFERTGALYQLAEDDIYPAQKTLGAALSEAEADSLAWIEGQTTGDA